MNRRQEYDELMRELERPAAVDAVERARKRLHRRRMWTRSLTGIAAAAMAFVLLVNFCAPVAQACSEIPVLKELARLVSFSTSLTDQLNHTGVQKVGQTLEENGVSVYVDSLLVDQKRVTVFYRIDTDIAERAIVWYGFRDAEGYVEDRFDSTGWNENEGDVLNGQMRSVTFDFGRTDVPEELYLEFSICLRLKDGHAFTKEDDVHDSKVFRNLGECEAKLLFHLNIEPERIVQGYEKRFGRELVLDGQTYTIEKVNVYSSKSEIFMLGKKENTAWMENMYFYLECEDGTILGQNRRDNLWEGGLNERYRKFYCESPFYHMPSGKFKLVITGATWLDKNQRKAGVNLTTGETTDMPEWIEFGGVREEDGRTVLRIYERNVGQRWYLPFAGGYAIVSEQNEPVKDWIRISEGRWIEDGEELGYYFDFVLNPYDLVGDWIYFPLAWNRCWQPDEPIVVELPMVE